MKYKKITSKLLMIIILCLCSTFTVLAASNISLKYDGKTVVYKGKQVSYALDGKVVNLKNTPGVIINNISLVSYKEVFGTALGATCQYDSKKSTITISKLGNTIKMTIGSRTAFVNGKKITLSLAPKKITYVAAKTTKIVVPARNVAEALGYQYTWYSSNSKVEIKSPYQIYYSRKWYRYSNSQGKVMIDGKNINVSKMPGIILDNTSLVQAKLVFESKYIGAFYEYDTSKKQATIKKDDIEIIYTMNSKVAKVNGEAYTLNTPPRMMKDNIYQSNRVMVPVEFTAKMLGYDYRWDDKTKTSFITTKKITEPPELSDDDDDEKGNTIYGQWDGINLTLQTPFLNLLKSMRVYSEASKEIVELTGLTPISPILTEDTTNKNLFYIDIELMQNTIGNLNIALKECSYIKNVSIIPYTDTTLRVQFEKTEDSDYYGVQSGNSYSIYFSEKIAEPNQNGSSIEIPKPSHVSFEEITDEDLYLQKKIKITMPNDCIEFYQKNPILIQQDNLYASYNLNAEGNTDIIITTTKIQGYKITDNGNSITLTIDDPRNIYKKIVVLDPGHGGSDPGTIQPGFQEKNAAYQILYTYGKEYFNSSESEIKVYWTRIDDTFVELNDRGTFSDTVGADIFISLHMNSATASTANGTETYYCTTNNTTNDMGLTSKTLAAYIQNNLPKSLGLNDSRGVKTANFVVIKKNKIPAVLIELGFFTNPSDLKKLTDPVFQDDTAKRLYKILNGVFDIYPTGR